jgi:hypothetical protein
MNTISKPVPGWVFILAAVLWVLSNLRSVSTMCFDWDAAQLSLGTIEYDLILHQPHPPGYPLWVLSARALLPLTQGAPLAQTLLDIIFTAAALFFFYRLVRELWGDSSAGALTILLAFSPVVQLYAFAQSTYPVDLLASAVLGWLAWRMWHGDVTALRVALPAAALLMGFRPSGVVLLGPLVAVAALRGFGRQPTVLITPLLGAAVVMSAWFWPLVRSAGGFSSWYQLSFDQFRSTSGATSIFFAPSQVLPAIEARLTVILVVALLPLVGLVLGMKKRPSPSWVFLVLWALPGLLYVYLFHFAKPGYLLMVLPPIFLALGGGRLSKRAVLVGLLVTELAVLAPYDRLPENKLTRALAAASPFAAVSAARSNRVLRDQIEKLRPARIVCTSQFQDAPPNRRSVAYDYRGVAGAKSPVFLTAEGSRGPEGTERIFEGEGFALWR